MNIIGFFIPGKPRGKGRPRFFRRGRFVGTYTPHDTAAKEVNIYSLAYSIAREKGIRPIDGPIGVNLLILMPRPKGHTQAQKKCPWCNTKPDIDNIVKTVLDGLNGVFFLDDKQVCHIGVKKMYAETSTEIGINVQLDDLES